METNKNNNQNSKISIDFKSSFARSLSIDECSANSKTLELLHLNQSEEMDIKNYKLDFKEVFDSNSNGINNNEDIELWTIIEKKKKHQMSFNSNDHDEVTNTNSNSNDAEILRLRKECQSLVEENRRIGSNMKNLQYHECKDSVQNAVLQSKLEALEWQLKQVESSRDMYRAILEEVTRYLETCHTTFDIWHQQEQEKIIERSKSISCIGKKHFYDDVFTNDARLDRPMTKSSTNLNINCSTPYIKPKSQGTLLNDLSYNSFKDFTWRRGKKYMTEDSPPSTQENEATVKGQIDIEKLSNQNFRLLRTVQNFLCTNEATLIKAKTSSTPSSLSSSPIDKCIAERSMKTKINPKNKSTLDINTSDLPHSLDREHHKNGNCQFLATPKTTMTAATTTTVISAVKSAKRFSTTEDESGFSSMSSFHEIGLPISETSTSSNEFKFTRPKPEHHHNDAKKNDSDKVTISKQTVIEHEENSYRVLWV